VSDRTTWQHSSQGKRRRPALRRMLKIVRVIGIVTLALGASGAIYVARTWNRVWDLPEPDLHASADPEVIKRGEYLVYGPAHCVECHTDSSDDVERASGREGRPALAGGMKFAAAPLGAMYAKNITPDAQTGIGRYTDGQIARMLRSSLRPDGRASVRLLMPYGDMSDADIVAILSFLRAQPAVSHRVPENEWTPIGKVVKSVAPVFQPRREVHPAAQPPQGPTAARGEYLARSVANCAACHTERDPVSFAAIRPEFAGGNEMEPAERAGVDRRVWFRTPNLTPATGSALSKFPDRETFIARFQRGGRQHPGSPMPWEAFGTMSADDLAALYEFLHSLPPQSGPTGDPRFRKTS
jgi:mono/diheme cytochrome c family protein